METEPCRSSNDKKSVIVFLGPPGSGKSSQARRVAEELGYRHVSSGDLLRHWRSSDAPLGRYIRDNWNVRALAEIATDLVTEAISNSERGCVLDGTPRSRDEAINLLAWLHEQGIDLKLVFEFYVDDQSELVKRLLGRRIHKVTGAIHHISTLGSAAAANNDSRADEEDSYSVRDDDVDEGEIQKRMNSYHRFTPSLRKMLLRYCEGTGASLHEINASRTPNEIFGELMRIIRQDSTRRFALASKAILHELGIPPTRDSEVTPPVGFKKASAIDHCIVKQEIKEISGAQFCNRFPGTHPLTLSHNNLPLLGSVYAANAGEDHPKEDAQSQVAVEETPGPAQVWRSRYVVTDKLDGERYLLYLQRKRWWLVDRRLNVFLCDGPYVEEDYDGTLLDGELFTRTTPSIENHAAASSVDRKRKRDQHESEVEDGAHCPTPAELHFVTFDALNIRGTSVIFLPFLERMKAAQTQLSALIDAGGTVAVTQLPLALHVQLYVDAYELPGRLRQQQSSTATSSHAKGLISDGPFPTDGLIFQNALATYRVGHSDDLIKWKDPAHNTIDFRLMPISTDADVPSGEYAGWRQACVVNNKGKNVFFDWIKVGECDLPGVEEIGVSSKRSKTAHQYTESTNDQKEKQVVEADRSSARADEAAVLEEECIAECWWDLERQLDDWYYERWYGSAFKEKGYGRGGWRVLRIRKDKDAPNVDWVAKSIWQSINENITLADITAAILTPQH